MNSNVGNERLAIQSKKHRQSVEHAPVGTCRFEKNALIQEICRSSENVALMGSAKAGRIEVIDAEKSTTD